jgi:hypothetical protein
MNEFSAVCRVLGCPNFGSPAHLTTDELIPTNVVCGACGQQITDITNLGIDSSDSSV